VIWVVRSPPSKKIALQPPQINAIAVKFVLTLLFSLEMRGKELMPQLTLVEKPA
jgi:hypothetical protein